MAHFCTSFTLRLHRGLHHNHRGAVDGVTSHGQQSLIGLIEWELRYFWTHANLGGDPKKVAGILTGHVGDATKLAFPPQQTVIVELRNTVEMDRVDRDDSTFTKAAERRDHHVTTGREGNRAVKFAGWLVGFSANPLRAEGLRQLLVLLSARRDINITLPRVQDIDGKMRRRAEAEEPDPLALLHFGHA